MIISLTEYAAQHGKTPDFARQLALKGKFDTAQKIGRNWLIDDGEPWPSRSLKAADAFTTSAYECLTASDRRAILKLEQAKEYSGLRAYPSTCSAVFSNIPPDWFERYTARQLGEIAALLKAVYDKGVDKGRGE